MSETKKDWKAEAKSWLLTVVLPVLAVLLLNLFVCRFAVVDGDSMYPTLHDRDLLLVWMLGGGQEQGDVVVINTPEDGVFRGERLVKRVVAVAGQRIRIDYSENKVYVDGTALDEDYINFEEADPMEVCYPREEYTVPEGYVFVLGDNRNHSVDSRHPLVGPIPVEDIMGKEMIRSPFGDWFPAKSE